MAESISKGTLQSWSKHVGDTVEADEVAIIETDKVGTSSTPIVPSAQEAKGVLRTVSVGQDLFIIEPGKGGGKPRVLTYITRSFTSHSLIALVFPEEQKTDLEEPKHQQLEKMTPDPRHHQLLTSRVAASLQKDPKSPESYVPLFIDSRTLPYSFVFIVNVVELARSKLELNHRAL
jgi:2-oxoglutarate dehydrogenase E2 component (dihydrolipoamide succinyltransferase)